MDKRIEITKEQFDILYPMNEDRIERRGFSPLIVQEGERGGYAVILPDFEVWEPKLAALLEKAAAGEVGDRFWLNVLAIVPLVELPAPAPATEDTFIEEIAVVEYDRETDARHEVTAFRVTFRGQVDERYFYDRADAEALLGRARQAGRLV